MTPEQVALWKENLQALLQQGGAAVPAIMEFLDRNVDLNLKSMAGDQLGSSLRDAMFDALAQIGGADGSAGLVHVLEATADPREIAQLAKLLEAQAPEQYSGAIAEAAGAALAHLANKKIEGTDVAPLFELLQTRGGPQAAEILERAAKSWGWSYYGPLAAAGLPEGAGIPVLARMVEDGRTVSSGGGTMALQLLAQNAHQYPEAATALLDAAKAKQIPASAWLRISQALAGTHAYYGSGLVDGMPTASGIQAQRYHISSGNQSYVTVVQSLSPEQQQANSQVIQQLLQLNLGPSAQNWLKQSQQKIAGGAGK
jgi:hypothetical protein